jgi:hypothetical protein
MTKHTTHKYRVKPVDETPDEVTPAPLPPEPAPEPVAETFVGYHAPSEPEPTPPTPAAQHDTYPTVTIVDKGAIWELWERSADGEKLISYGPPSEVEKAELAWREGRTKPA